MKQEAETTHIQRCKSVNLSLQKKYEDLMEEYRHHVNLLKMVDPGAVDVLREAVLKEVEWLEEKINLLMNVGSRQASDEMNRIVPRHVRLLDQLEVLGRKS